MSEVRLEPLQVTTTCRSGSTQPSGATSFDNRHASGSVLIAQETGRSLGSPRLWLRLEFMPAIDAEGHNLYIAGELTGAMELGWYLRYPAQLALQLVKWYEPTMRWSFGSAKEGHAAYISLPYAPGSLLHQLAQRTDGTVPSLGAHAIEGYGTLVN